MNFLNKLEEGYKLVGIDCAQYFSPAHCLYFGVSGGADSIALLYGSILLRKKYYPTGGAKFIVVTVNHNIRPPKESGNDAAFVERFSQQFTNVEFVLHCYESGFIEKVAQKREKGIEEAARFMRYSAFQKTIDQKGDFPFCLAHNQNDQIETLLIRFLQGSSGRAASGIAPKRNNFIRPLLQIPRAVIEDFLQENSISFCTDLSNFDNGYLRNRMRNQLIPFINELYLGWQKAILSGSKKQGDDGDFLFQEAKKYFSYLEVKGEAVFIDLQSYTSLHPAIKRRLLYKGIELLKVEDRIPYAVLEKAIYYSGEDKKISLCNIKNIFIYVENSTLVITKNKKQVENFSLLISCAGQYTINSTDFLVLDEKSSSRSGDFISLPCVLRNPLPGDIVHVNNKTLSLKEYVTSNKKNICKDELVVIEEIGKNYVTIFQESCFYDGQSKNLEKSVDTLKDKKYKIQIIM